MLFMRCFWKSDWTKTCVQLSAVGATIIGGHDLAPNLQAFVARQPPTLIPMFGSHPSTSARSAWPGLPAEDDASFA